MGRRKSHAPLKVLINNRLAGELAKEAGGAITFRYDDSWLIWPQRFPVSLSLPPRPEPFRGAVVEAVFDNILPDNPDVRRIVAEKTGAGGTDTFSLLEQIGRDCVGAMQFVPEGVTIDALAPVSGRRVSDDAIEATLANLARAPLGIDPVQGFRISIAGAQEKTALLRRKGKWLHPLGATPTTHILKPQIGTIPTPFGMIDLSDSVENEHFCLTLLGCFGLKVAKTEMTTFGARRVLVVERFDRMWRGTDRILRLPQEDCCQALSVPSTRKYQNQQGPGIVDILKLLQGSDDPARDQSAFIKCQMIFWLIGATDGHAKNFSIFLRPGGRFELTPFYDVLSVQPAFDAKRIPRNKYKMAMCVGEGREYSIPRIHGLHFAETARQAGMGREPFQNAVNEILTDADFALKQARDRMPPGFPKALCVSIEKGMRDRLPLLKTALGAT